MRKKSEYGGFKSKVMSAFDKTFQNSTMTYMYAVKSAYGEHGIVQLVVFSDALDCGHVL